MQREGYRNSTIKSAIKTLKAVGNRCNLTNPTELKTYLVAYPVAENVAGIKAYQKAGFIVEGNVKDDHFGDDESYHDVLIMGIVL